MNRREVAIRLFDTESTEKEEKYKTKTRVFSVFSTPLRDLRVSRPDYK
jgi:hypothetical protein